MPRPPRGVEPGGVYHVSPRGNDGRIIFDDREGVEDRRRHLELLARVTEKYGWTVFGYCQMTTHFHLLIRVEEGGLSEGMQELQTGYSRSWNKRHGHTGHLFRNRFDSRPVLSDRHLIATARYIDLNPVKAKMKEQPEHWLWSSYRAHVGLSHPPPFLAAAKFLELLGRTPGKAINAYRRFVWEGMAQLNAVSEGRLAVSDTDTEVPRTIHG